MMKIFLTLGLLFFATSAFGLLARGSDGSWNVYARRDRLLHRKKSLSQSLDIFGVTAKLRTLFDSVPGSSEGRFGNKDLNFVEGPELLAHRPKRTRKNYFNDKSF